jgi:periplasmic protein TonB
VKRWLLPICCALALHAAIFKLDAGWLKRPAATIPDSLEVTISLVQLMPEPVEQPTIEPLQVKPPAAIAPLTPVEPKKQVVEQPPAPAPPPTPVAPKAPPPAEPEPQPAPPVETEAAANMPSEEDPLPATAAPTAQEAQQRHAEEQAAVTASVPLYHLNPPPVYPAVARRRNYEGTVVIDVLVDRQGRAAQVRIAHSSGYEILDRSAVNSVKQWRFEPGRRFGQPVEMWVQVPVRFSLE